MGIRASATNDLIFEDCRIPDANRLGKVGQGWKVVMHTLNSARAGVAAQGLGCAEGALGVCFSVRQRA